MTPCLSPDEFVDLVDGALPAARAVHLETCASCAATAQSVREALRLAASAAVPEPSPLFWPSINARVRDGIGERARVGRWAWLRWDVAVPMAGLASLVLVLATAVERGVPTPDPAAGRIDVATRLDEPAPVAADDEALTLMIDLAGSLPESGWDALGVTALPDLGDAAAALSDDERRALAALLTSALDRPAS